MRRAPFVAIAIVVVVLAGCGATKRVVRSGTPPPTTTSAAPTTTTVATTTTASAPAAPAGFVPVSFTAIGDDDYWLLGSAPCAAGRCATIVHTTNGGQSFVAVPAPKLPTSTPTAPTLRFADDRDGYAFVTGRGGAFYSTHDGGATWQQPALGSVVAFASGDGNAYAISADCSAKGCSTYRFERSPAGSDRWQSSAPPFTPDGSNVDLEAHGASIWLLGNPATQASTSHDELARSTDDGKTFVTGPGPCVPDLGGTLAPTFDNVVWATCPTGTLAGAWRSTDGGATFTQVKTPEIVNSAQLAPASQDTAVLAGSGSGTQLLRTADAGATWPMVSSPPKGTFISWLGFTDAKVGEALVQTGYDSAAKVEDESLWRTADGGATWTAVSF